MTPRPHAFFITGTDTDVGKTYITTQYAKHFLAKGKRVAIYKPVQTGVRCFEEGDAFHCAKQLHFSPNLHVESSYCFEAPAAPSVCEGSHLIDFEVIQARCLALQAAYDVLLVEGAGGVMCPIKDTLCMVDLMACLKLPAVVVSRYTLGTLNHTLMSLDSLKRHGVPVSELVLSEGGTPLSESVKNSHAVQTVKQAIQHFYPDLTIREEAHHIVD
jgi:dethiobiotin synthetase